MKRHYSNVSGALPPDRNVHTHVHGTNIDKIAIMPDDCGAAVCRMIEHDDAQVMLQPRQ